MNQLKMGIWLTILVMVFLLSGCGGNENKRMQEKGVSMAINIVESKWEFT